MEAAACDAGRLQTFVNAEGDPHVLRESKTTAARLR
jgi:hypothetical protein